MDSTSISQTDHLAAQDGGSVINLPQHRRSHASLILSVFKDNPIGRTAIDANYDAPQIQRDQARPILEVLDRRFECTLSVCGAHS
jgi:hypothetical protein